MRSRKSIVPLLACFLSSITAFSPSGKNNFHLSGDLFRLEAVAQKESEGATVGDTKGAALLIENVAISRGANRILSDVNFRVERGQRWGIVGPVSSLKVKDENNQTTLHVSFMFLMCYYLISFTIEWKWEVDSPRGNRRDSAYG